MWRRGVAQRKGRNEAENKVRGVGGQGSSTKELLLISVADGTQLAGDRSPYPESYYGAFSVPLCPWGAHIKNLKEGGAGGMGGGGSRGSRWRSTRTASVCTFLCVSFFFICSFFGRVMAREALKPRFPGFVCFLFLCSFWASLAYLMDCPLT